MCYDISLHSDIELTKEVFPKVKNQRGHHDGSNDQEQILSFGFPQFPIISRQGDELILSNMEWSVDPTYEKDPVMRKTQRIKVADMQFERVLGDSRSYWCRLRRNRCLIPVSGTYEHRSINGWPNKVPCYIWARDYSIPFLPGLYQLYETIGRMARRFSLTALGC